MEEKTSYYLTNIAKKNNIDLQIQNLKTSFPFYFTVKKINLKIEL